MRGAQQAKQASQSVARPLEGMCACTAGLLLGIKVGS